MCLPARMRRGTGRRGSLRGSGSLFHISETALLIKRFNEIFIFGRPGFAAGRLGLPAPAGGQTACGPLRAPDAPAAAARREMGLLLKDIC